MTYPESNSITTCYFTCDSQQAQNNTTHLLIPCCPHISQQPAQVTPSPQQNYQLYIPLVQCPPTTSPPQVHHYVSLPICLPSEHQQPLPPPSPMQPRNASVIVSSPPIPPSSSLPLQQLYDPCCPDVKMFDRLLYKDNMVPGYGGIVPLFQESLGKRYVAGCHESIKEFDQKQYALRAEAQGIAPSNFCGPDTSHLDPSLDPPKLTQDNFNIYPRTTGLSKNYTGYFPEKSTYLGKSFYAATTNLMNRPDPNEAVVQV